MQIKSKNAQELIAIGKQIGSHLKGSEIILLDGDLGSGKTTLTKGLALGLEIDEIVNSPTFTIAKVYQGRKTLNHLDVYRLEGLKEDIGIEDYLDSESVLVVEWSKFLADDLFSQYLHILIEYDGGGRLLTFRPKGKIYQDLLDEVNL